MHTATAKKLSELEVVKTYFTLFKQGNIPALLAELSEDVKWSVARPNELPWGGDRIGKYAVGHYFGALLENLEFLRFEPLRYVAQGEWVVALGFSDVLVKKSQRIISADWAYAFVVQNGKITHVQEYTDSFDFVEALRK